MTASELAKLVGMTATVPVRRGMMGTVEIEVRIIDARDSYGRTDLLIRPVAGDGEAWVSADRVKVRKG